MNFCPKLAWRLAVIVVVGLGTLNERAAAQVARLRVESVATSAGLTHPQRVSDTSDTAESVYNRTETLRVTVTNLQPTPAEYLVEWQFLAQDLAAKKNFVYDRGTNHAALTGSAATTFTVQSKPLAESEIQKYALDEDDNGNPLVIPEGNRKKAGAKPAGYLFLVKIRGQIVAIEASDDELKKPYQAAVTANALHPAAPPPQ